MNNEDHPHEGARIAVLICTHWLSVTILAAMIPQQNYCHWVSHGNSYPITNRYRAFCHLFRTTMLLSLYCHYSEWKDDSRPGLICCCCPKSQWLTRTLTHWHADKQTNTNTWACTYRGVITAEVRVVLCLSREVAGHLVCTCGCRELWQLLWFLVAMWIELPHVITGLFVLTYCHCD